MAALKAYFDDSGKENDPQHNAISYGGYIGPADAWTGFESKWQAVLTEFDAPYLHMSEFVPCEQAFISWRDKPEKKKAFLLALIDVIEKSGLEWIAHAIDLGGLRKLNAEFGLSLEAEALALYLCLLEMEDRFGETVIEAILDRVDKPNVLIRKAREIAKYESRIRRVGENIDLRAIPKSLSFREVLPLQAADFIANESLKFTRKRIDIGIDAALPLRRKSFGALISCSGRGGYWSYKSLLSLHHSRNGAWPGTENGKHGLALRALARVLKTGSSKGGDDD